jgi:pimeloyl-ACP methyl ester carboxylesterase
MDVFRMADGRALEYLEVGDPRGQAVVYLHGTPGTAGSAALLHAAALRQRVRLLAISRPGYGESTTTPPGLVSVGRDVGELADGVGVGEFTVFGASGGGPFALATAAALPTRVRHVLVAAGLGPVHLLAPDALEPEDREALDLLAAGEVDRAVATVTDEVRRDFDPMLKVPADEFEAAFRGTAPPNEHYFDTRPEERTAFFADLRRALARYDGFVRDNLSWLGTWDFDLGDVVAPVQLSYGAVDAMASATHGEWLAARLPTNTLTIHPDAGHAEVCFGLADRLFAALK